MNKRIKELYQKAHKEYRIGYNASVIDDTIMAYTTKRIFDYELFAELLVKECISTLEEKIYQSIDNDGDEVWADLILKQHFGVE